MALRDILKITRKTFVNPTGWLDVDTIRVRNRTLWNALSSVFRLPTAERSETYEEAMKRLNVTDAEVQQRAQTYRLYAWGFFLLGLLVFFYSFYLLFSIFTFSGFLLGLCASAAFFSQAFRFDFWSFQMRRRKLGATFEEWKSSILGDKGTSS